MKTGGYLESYTQTKDNAALRFLFISEYYSPLGVSCACALTCPFRITSIKHILPQKRPEDEGAGKGFVFRPVTGIFIHHSNDVWTLEFDSGDTLGVTANHPIYSTTAQNWRLAGELAIGEQVLTHAGSATLTGKRPAPAQRVYNLEVQAVHNFLVAGVGVVVHNNYGIAQAIVDAIKAAVPNAYKQYGKCKEYANALRGQLIANGISNPKCYVAKVVDANGNRVNAPLFHNGQQIADNGIHVFTPMNNKVYDNINHDGLQVDLTSYTRIDYDLTDNGFATQFAFGFDVVFREVKQGENILNLND